MTPTALQFSRKQEALFVLFFSLWFQVRTDSVPPTGLLAPSAGISLEIFSVSQSSEQKYTEDCGQGCPHRGVPVWNHWCVRVPAVICKLVIVLSFFLNDKATLTPST